MAQTYAGMTYFYNDGPTSPASKTWCRMEIEDFTSRAGLICRTYCAPGDPPMTSEDWAQESALNARVDELWALLPTLPR